MNLELFLAILTYLAIILTIGLLSHRKSQSESDFVLGGRSLNFYVTALSAHAADMSAWLFMGMPAVVYVGGMPAAWVAIGLWIGMWANWTFVAPRLRTMTEDSASYTLSTFFERKFHDHSGILRPLSALISVFFLTAYLAAGLTAMGYLFESIFALDYLVGIWIAMAVVVGYILVGGFVAVAWVDLFQALFLLAMILIVPSIALFSIGGFTTVETVAEARGVPLSLVSDWSTGSLIAILMSMLGWGLGYFGQPHIITKFMGIRHPSEMYKAKWVGMCWQTLALGAAILVGIVGIGYFATPLGNPELIFVDMVRAFFHPYIGGLVLTAILAASISTMDSQLLVAASVLTEDLFKRFQKRPSTKQLLLTSRLSVLLISLVALLFASFKSASVFMATQYAWGGLGASFGPLVLTALYSKRATATGAIWGVTLGAVVGALWPVINSTIPAMIPGFAAGFLGIFLGSLFHREVAGSSSCGSAGEERN